jgi:hypothetical protein
MLYNDERGRFKKWFHDFWTLVEGVLIFRSYKYQNKNFSLTEAPNFVGPLKYQKIMGYYNSFICCEPLNEKNFRQNFELFRVKLKKL